MIKKYNAVAGELKFLNTVIVLNFKTLKIKLFRRKLWKLLKKSMFHYAY